MLRSPRRKRAPQGPTPELTTARERATDQRISKANRKFQLNARRRARGRARGRLQDVPEGSYWASFRDENDEEIYGFWLQRQRKYGWAGRDSSSDTFAVKSFKERPAQDRELYFEIGPDALAYPLNAQSASSSPVQWLRSQLRNVKMKAERLETLMDASDWVLVDNDFDEEFHTRDADGDYKRKVLRLRIPAAEIHDILICKYRPDHRVGDGFDKCGQFPDGGISLAQWIDGEGDPLSRRYSWGSDRY